MLYLILVSTFLRRLRAASGDLARASSNASRSAFAVSVGGLAFARRLWS